MTKFEKIAKRNIIGAYNWITGGYTNSCLDGFTEDLPENLKDVKEEVYNDAMNHQYMSGGVCYDKAPKEMRFAGEEFCRRVIDELFDNDHEFLELMGWMRKRREKETMTVKDMRAKAKEMGIKGYSKMSKADLQEALEGSKPETVIVKMYAFTGMYIGEFRAEFTGTGFKVKTERKGVLSFDRTGLQINCNSRYSNKVVRV